MVVAGKRKAAEYAETVVAGRDPDDQERASLALVCRRSGMSPEVLLAKVRRRAHTPRGA